MRYLFDQDDERAVLDELSRNQRKSEALAHTCGQQGKPKQAASWEASAQRIGNKIVLLEQAFQHKN